MTTKFIAVALRSAPWPAWAPRPSNPLPSPEALQPAAAERFESALPSVSDVLLQAEEADDARPPQKRSGRSEATLAEQVQLVKIIGSRMREAREELAGLTQIDAAKLLGYSNSSKLAKIEAASDTASVPLATIRRAAELYQVSIDFLFGASGDWERDPQLCRERQVSRWLFEYLDQARTRDAAAFAELSTKFDKVSALIPKMADGAEQAKGAFERFRDVNPCYDDLIGGARLLASLESLDEVGRQARLQLRRFHLEMAGEQAGAAGGIHGQG